MRKILIGFLLSVLMMLPVVADDTLCGVGTEPLYIELEYIESRDGKSYIDTRMKVNDFEDFDAYAGVGGQHSNWVELFGASASTSAGANNSKVLRLRDSDIGQKMNVGYGSSWTGINMVLQIGRLYRIHGTMKSGSQLVSVDGTQVLNTTSTATLNNNNNVWLFNMNYGGSNQQHYGAIIGRISFRKDTLVRDFVPVPAGLVINGYTVPSNGMWDIVEQKFYGNSGTGDFVYGVDE